MAYVVTFEQIDPLWTIDLSDPTNPTVLGELEVPGVSTYIHPMSNGMLLTIGLAPANADGTGLDWSTTRIQTFDVSDPTTPTQNDHLGQAPVENPGEGGWSWSWSEATYEHKAFQYWAPKGLSQCRCPPTVTTAGRMRRETTAGPTSTFQVDARRGQRDLR